MLERGKAFSPGLAPRDLAGPLDLEGGLDFLREGARPSPPLICRFIDEQRAVGHRVESICRVLREQGLAVAPRSYRAWKTRRPATRTVTDAQIVDRLRALRTGGPGGRPAPEILYGRRKMTGWLNRALAADGRPPTSQHTVDRLMRTEGMRGLVRGRGVRTTVPAAGTDVRRAADLLQRRFRTSAPNLAWVTDFT